MFVPEPWNVTWLSQTSVLMNFVFGSRLDANDLEILLDQREERLFLPSSYSPFLMFC